MNVNAVIRIVKVSSKLPSFPGIFANDDSISDIKLFDAKMHGFAINQGKRVDL